MKRKIKYIAGIIVCLVVVLFGGNEIIKNNENLDGNSTNITESSNALVNTNVTNDSGNLKIYFIDVGQADSILIEQNGKFMLIDAGNNDDGDLVVNYLKQKGVTKLDYVIGTHAHEDHIGGMDDVIKNFDEEKILFPKVTATTKTKSCMHQKVEKHLNLLILVLKYWLQIHKVMIVQIIIQL